VFPVTSILEPRWFSVDVVRHLFFFFSFRGSEKVLLKLCFLPLQQICQSHYLSSAVAVERLTNIQPTKQRRVFRTDADKAAYSQIFSDDMLRRFAQKTASSRFGNGSKKTQPTSAAYKDSRDSYLIKSATLIPRVEDVAFLLSVCRAYAQIAERPSPDLRCLSDQRRS